MKVLINPTTNKLISINDNLVKGSADPVHGYEKHSGNDITYSNQNTLYKTITIANVTHTPTSIYVQSANTNNNYSEFIFALSVAYPHVQGDQAAILRTSTQSTSIKLIVNYDATAHTASITVDNSLTYSGFSTQYGNSYTVYIYY